MLIKLILNPSLKYLLGFHILIVNLSIMLRVFDLIWIDRLESRLF